MNEILNSILSNYKSKIRNPFFGTLTTVWVIRNWVIVYALFNFDKDCQLQDKINYIQSYFNQKVFWDEFWINNTISFCILIITYVLLALSRGLTDLYYKIVERWIVAYIDKKAIFTQSDKLILERRIGLLETKLIKKDEDLTRHLGDNEMLNLEIKALKDQNKNDIKNITQSVKKKDELLTLQEVKLKKIKSYFDELKLTEKEIDIIKNISNIRLQQTLIGGNTPPEYLRLINSGLISKKGDVTKITSLGNYYFDNYIDEWAVFPKDTLDIST